MLHPACIGSNVQTLNPPFIAVACRRAKQFGGHDKYARMFKQNTVFPVACLYDQNKSGFFGGPAFF